MAPVKFCLRTEWSPLDARNSYPLTLPARQVFCAATMGPKCFKPLHCAMEMKRLQTLHMQSPSCPDIKYNFVIAGDGTVYEARGWKLQPGLPVRFKYLNTTSYYIAFFGRFLASDDVVPVKQMKAFDDLLQLGVDQGYLIPDKTIYDI